MLPQSYVISSVGWLHPVASVLHKLTNLEDDSSIPQVDATIINSRESEVVPALLSSIHFWIAAVRFTSIVDEDWSPSKLPTDIDGTLPPSSQ